jgi:hypothetical protein
MHVNRLFRALAGWTGQDTLAKGRSLIDLCLDQGESWDEPLANCLERSQTCEMQRGHNRVGTHADVTISP